MKNVFLSVVVLIILGSCQKETIKSMVVTGDVKGLKKGTLYLQKMQDTVVVSVDSVLIDGLSSFSLTDDIESPEIYFLSLDKQDDKQILFFGDIGTITINTKLDKFVTGAEINGLKNQQLLEEYNDMKRQFKNKNLDLIKAEFDFKEDTIKRDSIARLAKNLVTRRYYYTTNFAVTHNDAEVAPYLALTELFNANIKLLDTVNNSLSKNVKTSKYGKKLEDFLLDIKSQE